MTENDGLRLFPPTDIVGRCALCHRRHHPGWGCPKWKKMTPEARRAWLKEN